MMESTTLRHTSDLRGWLPLVVLSAALLLVACGDKKKDRAAGQTAARVNKEEITLNQINAVLQQQRNMRPEQADAAGRQILERLIDQELAVQKADELKLDRDPRVVQQLEANKREILARAYAEKVGEAAVKPTPEEVKKYYDDKPALFKERRIYSIQEISVEAKAEQMPALRDKLGASKNISEFIDFLKANDYRFAANQAVRTAEQLPLASLDAFAKLKDGQALLIPASNGVQVIVLAGSRSQPIGEEQARPAIEQFMLNERRRKLIEDDLKSLRASAKIAYEGRFAEAARAPASGAAASASSSASASTSASAVAGSTASSAASAASAASAR